MRRRDSRLSEYFEVGGYRGEVSCYAEIHGGSEATGPRADVVEQRDRDICIVDAF